MVSPEQTERKDMKQLRTRGQQHQPGRQCHKTFFVRHRRFRKRYCASWSNWELMKFCIWQTVYWKKWVCWTVFFFLQASLIFLRKIKDPALEVDNYQGQGILTGGVSLYCWPPVWLVWNQLYGNLQWFFYFQKRLIQTSQTGVQQYSDTSPLNIPCPGLPKWSIFPVVGSCTFSEI